MVSIGNAQAFWGDRPSAAYDLLNQQPDLDFLTMDYLAEVSLSIMAIQQKKNPSLGYASDFIEVIASLAPLWKNGLKTKLICNAGGLNPKGCAQAVQEILTKEGLDTLRVALVTGDDVRKTLQKDSINSLYQHMETNRPLTELELSLTTANAYIGADEVVAALDNGANIVITGRVADPSLVVAACRHHYGWSADSYDKIAGATVAGHLIECGTQVCGGFSTRWLDVPNPESMGYPIAEVADDGSCVVTKPKESGGIVSIETVKEQLLYEIGDPSQYLSPDATVSFSNVTVTQQSVNRVVVSGAEGTAPPSTYKVSATYHDGYKAEGLLTIVGEKAAEKARRCGKMILDRLEARGYRSERAVIEVLGAGGSLHGIIPEPISLYECVLRVAVADKKKEKVTAFCKEIAPLVTSGPQGVTGYTTGRPKVRPIYAFWPCLIERADVTVVSEEITPAKVPS